MLLGGIVTDQQSCRSIEYVAHAGRYFRLAGESRGKSREVGSPVMVDIVGLQHHASKLLQQIIFFVGGPVRSENTDCPSAIFVANLRESFSDQFKRFFPG